MTHLSFKRSLTEVACAGLEFASFCCMLGFISYITLKVMHQGLHKHHCSIIHIVVQVQNQKPCVRALSKYNLSFQGAGNEITSSHLAIIVNMILGLEIRKQDHVCNIHLVTPEEV